MFIIFVKTLLLDEGVLISSSAVLCVVAPIYEEAGDDFDGVRVPIAFEVIIV